MRPALWRRDGCGQLRNHPIVDDTFYLCFNAFHEPLAFTLPGGSESVTWQLIIDTADPDGFVRGLSPQAPGVEVIQEGRSFRLYQQIRGSDEEVKESAKGIVRKPESNIPVALKDNPGSAPDRITACQLKRRNR